MASGPLSQPSATQAASVHFWLLIKALYRNLASTVGTAILAWWLLWHDHYGMMVNLHIPYLLDNICISLYLYISPNIVSISIYMYTHTHSITHENMTGTGNDLFSFIFKFWLINHSAIQGRYLAWSHSFQTHQWALQVMIKVRWMGENEWRIFLKCLL